MKRNMTVLAALVVVMIMISCAGASQRVRNGAVVGGALGAGTGLVKGSSDKHIVGLGILGAAAGALAGAVLDEIYGPIPGASPLQVRPTYRVSEYYADCSAYSTPGERDACERGVATAERRRQRERESRAYQYGRSKARRK